VVGLLTPLAVLGLACRGDAAAAVPAVDLARSLLSGVAAAGCLSAVLRVVDLGEVG